MGVGEKEKEEKDLNSVFKQLDNLNDKNKNFCNSFKKIRRKVVTTEKKKKMASINFLKKRGKFI